MRAFGSNLFPSKIPRLPNTRNKIPQIKSLIVGIKFFIKRRDSPSTKIVTGDKLPLSREILLT